MSATPSQADEEENGNSSKAPVATLMSRLFFISVVKQDMSKVGAQPNKVGVTWCWKRLNYAWVFK